MMGFLSSKDFRPYLEIALVGLGLFIQMSHPNTIPLKDLKTNKQAKGGERIKRVRTKIPFCSQKERASSYNWLYSRKRAVLYIVIARDGRGTAPISPKRERIYPSQILYILSSVYIQYYTIYLQK